jgi:uncharacterized membrane protein YedE/YeeE
MNANFSRSVASALLAGILFGAGLIVSGMAIPANVTGFLDVSGEFRPDLAFVMAGAIAIYLPFFGKVAGRSRPFFAAEFNLPKLASIDARLLVGGAIFGIGWGLWGYCPGPALVSLGTGSIDAVYFVVAMLAGMLAFRLMPARR